MAKQSKTQALTVPIHQKDEAYYVLEQLIVSGELEPGQWVSEAELVTLTGFGRASIRSAIDRLDNQQLIAVSARRGAQVCPIDFTLQFRALELRRVVERLLVASAAARASDEEKKAFTVLSKRFKRVAESPNQTQMTQVDSETFNLILKAAQNPFASKAMISVKGLSRRFWVHYQEEHGDTATMASLYAKLTSAIASGDCEASEQAVDALIDYVEKFTLKVIGYSGI